MKKYLIFATIGIELLVLILVFIKIGQFIDEKFNGQGIFVVIFSFIALMLWAYHIVVLVKKMDKERDENQ